MSKVTGEVAHHSAGHEVSESMGGVSEAKGAKVLVIIHLALFATATPPVALLAVLASYRMAMA